jgi:hypothetical protein
MKNTNRFFLIYCLTGTFLLSGICFSALTITVHDENNNPAICLVGVTDPSVTLPGGATPGRHNNKIANYRKFWTSYSVPVEVEGTISFDLPSGSYEFIVGKGLEYVPARQTVNVVQGSSQSITINLTRFVNLQQIGWWCGEPHAHGHRDDPSANHEYSVYASAEDLHILNLLHASNNKDNQLNSSRQYAHGEAGRHNEGDYWLVSGQEDPRDGIGHTIGLNGDSLVRYDDAYFLHDSAFNGMHRGGAITGYCHAAGNTIWPHEWGAVLAVTEGTIDFIESGNRYVPSVYYRYLNIGCRLGLTSGTDTKRSGMFRTYAYAGDDAILDPDGWYEGIKQGRTFCTGGPLLEFTVNGEPAGTVFHVNKGDVVHVEARLYSCRELSTPKSLKIYSLGDVISQVSSSNPDDESLVLSADVTVDNSLWLAAFGDDQAGATAMTSAVYVVADNEPVIAHSRLDNIKANLLGHLNTLKSNVETLSANGISITPSQKTRMYARITAAEAYITGLPGTANPLPVDVDYTVRLIDRALFTVGPNPFSTSLDINLVRSALCVVRGKPTNLAIYDVKGRLVYSLPRTTNYEPRTKYTWDAFSNPSGTYFVTVKAGNKTMTRTVTKIK